MGLRRKEMVTKADLDQMVSSDLQGTPIPEADRDIAEAAILAEAQREIERQEASLNSVRSRAAGLLAAAGVVTGIVGLGHPVSSTDGRVTVLWWILLVGFAVLAILLILIELPEDFHFDVDLVETIKYVRGVEADPEPGISTTMSLAIGLVSNTHLNHQQIETRHSRLQWAAIVFAGQVFVVALIVALSAVSQSSS